jgi:hypothetical protein
MQVLVTTDNHIDGTVRLKQFVESDVRSSMERFGPQLTRVDVHLKDLNSDKKEIGDDKRCVVEARLGGLQPITVSHDAATVDQAVSGALETLERAMDRTIEKVGHKKGRTPAGGENFAEL